MSYLPLSELCDINMGQSPSSDSYNEECIGLPFFQGNADFGEIHPCPRVWCSDPKKTASKGDILISVRAPIGAINLANSTCCIGRGIASIRAKEGISHAGFIAQYLGWSRLKLEKLGTGSTFKAIKKCALTSFPVPAHSVSTQSSIYAKLDHCDRTISLSKRTLNQLDSLIKSRFIELFGSIEDNPFGWQIVRLEECCAINPKKVVVEASAEVSFVPMSRIGEHGEFNPYGVVEYGELQTGYTSFINDDVLFAKITPCMENGKGAIARNLVNGIGFGSTELHVLRPMKEICTPEWLYTILSFDHIRATAKANMTGTGGQRRVPASFLKKLKVPLPPMNLQIRYIQELLMIDKLRFDCELVSALLSKR